MATLCVGLDAGSTVCEIAVVDKQSGVIVERRGFPTSAKNLLSAVSGMEGEVHVHLEASSLAGWLRRLIKPWVKRIVVSHPKSNAWIGKDPLKNDRIDAMKLAELLRMGQYREVYFADEDDRLEFKRVVQHYEKITDEQARTQVLIKDRLRAQGVLVKEELPNRPERRGRLLGLVPSPSARTTIQQLFELLDAQRQTQKSALKLMRRLAQAYPEIAILEEVPGIGLILASRFSAYIQTPYRFANKRKLWRYCRLGIAWRESDGKRLSHQSLDRNGCGALKDLSNKAFMAAVVRSRQNNAFKRAYAAAVEQTGNETHARLTVQRKIVATLWSLWRKSERYNDNYEG